MILRRVIEHVRTQNWTAIGIDFLIVVVGVFVATEVSEWKTERATMARAEVFTERLTADLRLTAWSVEYLIAYYEDVLASAEVAVAGMSADSVSDEHFLIGAYRATQYRQLPAWRSTFDELVSTGEIGLISDERLRTTAQQVYDSPLIDNITNDAMESEYRRRFRRRVPADIQSELLRTCGDRDVEPLDFDGVVGSLHYDCRLTMPADRIAQAATALRSDPEMLQALYLRLADAETAVASLARGSWTSRVNLRRIAGLDSSDAPTP